jgi:YfiH family protein
VADCLPVIISDGNLVTVIHAGWKGTLAGIVEKTVINLVQNHRLNVDTAVAALGPCICTDHLEVEGEAAMKFRTLVGLEVSDNKYNVDLVKLNSMQLVKNGVKNIDNLGICAYESEEFFSYRRDHGNTGRNMAIALLS